MEALRQKPVAFYKLEDTAPFDDISGYGRVSVLTGTGYRSLPLTADTTASQRFSQTVHASFAAPVYVAGKEAASFSIAATIYPLVAGTEQRVVSHGGSLDGITLAGKTIHFTTKYTSSGQARCSYTLPYNQVVHVVGTHSQTKNSLYVNGVLVSEVDISDDQQADTYSITDSLFRAGGAGTQTFLANEYGFYTRALSTEDVQLLYTAQTRRAEGDVSRMFGGEDILLSSAVRPADIRRDWDEAADWGFGIGLQTVIDGDQLHAQQIDGLTLAGEWTVSTDLYDGDTATLFESAHMYWEGENVSISVSLDGDTWTSVTPNTAISILPNGFNPANKSLFVRATFTSGATTAYLSKLCFRVYLDDNALSNNRILDYPASAVAMEEYHPATMHERWGVLLNGGQLVIPPDTISEVPMDVKTIEIWAKDAPTHNLTADTTYVNGTAGGGAAAGEWRVYHFTKSANFTGNITLSGNAQIGKVAIYPTVLSATDVANVIANYTGVRKTTESGGGTVQVAEMPGSTVVYGHDWEIVMA